MLEGFQSGLWTCLPGIVQSVDFTTMTCEVQPSIKGSIQDQNGNNIQVNYPLLLDVPIVFPSCAGFALTFPLAKNDEVLVVFANRCIDGWWQAGGIQPPLEARMHDLSDGFCIPGIYSQPNTLDGISATKVQLRNAAGTVFLGVGTKFSMTNSVTDLKTILLNLTSAVNNFVTALSTLTPPTSPVLNSVLQVPALAAVTALMAVTTEISALLEST